MYIENWIDWILNMESDQNEQQPKYYIKPTEILNIKSISNYSVWNCFFFRPLFGDQTFYWSANTQLMVLLPRKIDEVKWKKKQKPSEALYSGNAYTSKDSLLFNNSYFFLCSFVINTRFK